jgi:hypothetical protein
MVLLKVYGLPPKGYADATPGEGMVLILFLAVNTI